MQRSVVKALVLGATGHIGNAVVREMLSRGYEVTAASRRAEPAINLTSLPVVYAQGDIDSPGQLDLWIGGHDVVVDAAAPYISWLLPSGSASGVATLQNAAHRTERLLDAVRRHRTRLAYVSSFVTLPRRRWGFERWQGELVRRLHPYFALKELIEERVLAAACDGVGAVVVNPTLCLGPWDIKDRQYCIIPRLLSGEPAVAVNHMLNVIDVREVATAVVTALEERCYGQRIALVGHNVTNDELFAWTCELGGVRRVRLVVPMTLSLIASYFSEVALGIAGLRSPMPALAPMLTSLYEPFTPGPIQRELGVNPRPLSATLVESINWYRTLNYC
jgi:dihydroflavonol-4-reductase